MKTLSQHIQESLNYNKKSMLSSAEHMNDDEFWTNFFNQIIDELKFGKSHKLKTFEELTNDEQSKVTNFRKSLI